MATNATANRSSQASRQRAPKKKAPARNKNTSRTRTASAKKNAGAARKNAGKRQKERISVWQDPVSKEIILILAACVSILLFLCNFGIIGPFGNAISSFLFGLFGVLAYVAPICFAVFLFFRASNYGNEIATIKEIAAICLLFLIGMMIEMGNGALDLMDHYDFKMLYTYSSQKHGGGILSGSIAYFLCHYLSKLGCGFLVVALMIICLILITEKSFLKTVMQGGKYAYEKAQVSAERAQQIRERANVRREQRAEAYQAEDDARILRMNHKAETFGSQKMNNESIEEGVHLFDLSQDSNQQFYSFEEEEKRDVNRIRDDIHEIMLNEEAFPEHRVAKGKKKRKPRPEAMQEEYTQENNEVSFQDNLPEVEEQSVDAYEFQLDQIQINRYESGVGDYSSDIETNDSMYEQQMDNSTYSDIYEDSALEKQDLEQTEEEAWNAQYEEQFEQADSVNDRPRPKAKLPEKMDEKITTDTAKEIQKNQAVPIKKYIFPPINLLKKNDNHQSGDSEYKLKDTAMRLQQTLANFGVKVTITNISQGPTVTRYELQPEQGVKVSKIVGLTDDIKLNLAATDIRMEAPIPGKAAIGIEVPNNEVVSVGFRDLIEGRDFKDFKSNLAFAVGKDIAGKVIITDIAKMPHLLIAGATGSGKSVCINTIIMSLLYKASPEDVKMIMIDPKVVELSVYNGIPHLLIPVVTEPKKAAGALQWGVAEMTERYQKFADFNVRDLKGYNQKIEEMKKQGQEDIPAKMPQIVIIVDELADLMMVAPGEVEESICRLAQLARAAGIHLIIATQRPSVDVITGLIKANMPSRIAFAVSSGVDSRTILDMVGAEKLLGKGDMLFYPQGYSKPARLQGAFISDEEVSNVVDFLKNQVIGNVYDDSISERIQSLKTSGVATNSGAGGGNELDDYFVDAGRIIIEKDKASIGMLQRAFKIGFNRAARIMDQLSEAGVVGPEEGTKPRKILMSEQEFESYIEEYV